MRASTNVGSAEWVMRNIKKKAEKSQQGHFSDNFVFEYIEGDGKEFNFGIDYLKCPIYEFWQSQGAEKLLPFTCLFDYFSSEFSGIGLIRSQTIAEGFEKCDYRFKRGVKPQNKQKPQVITRESLVQRNE